MTKMIADDSLANIEAAIHKSLSADCFAEAEALIGHYVAEVEQRGRRLPAGSKELPALRDRALRLLELGGIIVSAARQSVAADLAQVQLLARYREATQCLRVRS